MISPDYIETQRVSLIVTKRCSLKCRLCGALAPYIESYHPEVDFLKAELDSFFKIVNKTGIIDISGGEPFLRGNTTDFALGEVLLHISENYSTCFDFLRIFTNGTIVPSDELCQVFRKISTANSFNITIDNYGIHSPKVESIASKLEEYKIPYIIRDYSKEIHCGGWVDLRDISLNHDDKKAKEIYAKCAIPQKLGCCLEMLDGIISPCSVAASRYICGKADKNDSDILDLFSESSDAKDKLRSILSADCFSSCHSCDGGMSDECPRFIPAEQASDEEIQEFRSNYTMRL